ncbi:MAG TPA: YezD family protein [Cellvibrio sp.]|nr:YezD family protein [Cellvibrio sp.]
MGTHRTEQADPSAYDVADEIFEEIKQQLALIQFGSLEIQVHNGQVVQIERREKKRWEKGVNTR